MDRSLLSNATSQDDTPTPGYMLSEISKSTLANYQANLQIQDFLVSRLSHKHHNVKFKCLVIIKHICRTGRPEFKREMAKKIDAIKECLQFRGPPDPLRGDEIYKRVRDAAKEALDAIFDSQMPVTTSAVAATNRIQGLGNDYVPADQIKKESGGILSSIYSSVTTAVMGDGTETGYAGHPGAEGSFIGGADKQLPTNSNTSSYGGSYAAPSGGGSGSTIYRSSSSGMVGLGNPNFKDAREEKSWYQKAGEMASSISTMTMGSTPATAPNPTTHNFQSNNPEWSYASNRGNNAYGINQEGYQPQKPNAFGSNVNHFQQWQQKQAVVVTNQTASVVPDLPPANALGTGRVGGAATDGSYERSLLEGLCEPGGLKSVPPEAKLQEFLSAAPTLSPDLVGNVLLDILNADSWQSRVKALIVIGNLVQTKDCDSHKQWWTASHEEVRALCDDPKATVRNQASKTYKIITGHVVNVHINGEDRETTSSVASVSVSPKLNGGAPPSFNAKEQSLIDVLDDNSYVAPPASVPTNPPTSNGTVPINSPSSAAGGFDLFSGMAVSSSTSAQPSPLPAAPASILHTFETVSPAQPVSVPSSANTISNSFDFLNDDPPSLPQPPLAQTAASSSNPNPNAGGLFSGLNVNQATQPPPATNRSIIDDFATLSAPAPLQYNPPPSSSAGGFSFINNSTVTGGPMNNNRNSASVISSAFVDNASAAARNNQNQNDSFSQLVNLGNNNVSSSASSGKYSAPPPAVPLNYPSQPVQPGYSGQYPANPGYVNTVPRYGVNTAPPATAPGGYPAYPNQPHPVAGGYPVQPNVNYQAAINPNPPINPNIGNYPYSSNSVIAPGMLSPLAPRKNIPTTEAIGGSNSSGFAFLGGGGGGNPSPAAGGNDSFNFVTEAMKDMKK